MRVTAGVGKRGKAKGEKGGKGKIARRGESWGKGGGQRIRMSPSHEDSVPRGRSTVATLLFLPLIRFPFIFSRRFSPDSSRINPEILFSAFESMWRTSITTGKSLERVEKEKKRLQGRIFKREKKNSNWKIDVKNLKNKSEKNGEKKEKNRHFLLLIKVYLVAGRVS